METSRPDAVSRVPRARSGCACDDPAWGAARGQLRDLAARGVGRQESLAPAAVGRAHRVSREAVENVLRFAIALHAHGAATTSSVVWRDGGDELLIAPAKARLATREGLVFVGLPVFCEESGHAEVTVVFACNPAKAPLGVVLVAEEAPHGPRVVVERWAEPLVACAYGALLDALAALVHGAPGEELLLAGVGADAAGLVVVMQRDHAVQSTIRRSPNE